MTDQGTLYEDMLRSENPIQWLIDRYGFEAKDLIAWNLKRDDPVYPIMINSAVAKSDIWAATKIFSQITGYRPGSVAPALSHTAAVDTAALQEQFNRLHRDLNADILRLRAYDLWDDLTPGERMESIQYVKARINELQAMQKQLQSPGNDELIRMLEADLNVLSRRDISVPARKPAPGMNDIVSVLSSMNELQLKGIRRMYAISSCDDCKEWESIVRFLQGAESPIRRYAIREHVSRILEMRKKVK